MNPPNSETHILRNSHDWNDSDFGLIIPGMPTESIGSPILWAGFWLNAVSGVLLLIGYPTKALTNPVFYLKLTLIALAMVLIVRISRQVCATGSGESLSPTDPPISSRLRNLAIASLMCWAGAITAGRLLAYTYHRLTQLH